MEANPSLLFDGRGSETVIAVYDGCSRRLRPQLQSWTMVAVDYSISMKSGDSSGLKKSCNSLSRRTSFDSA